MRALLRAVSPIRLWRRSLPFRVIVSTLTGTFYLLVAAGFLLMDAAQRVIYENKFTISAQQATFVRDAFQERIDQLAAQGVSTADALVEFAYGAEFWGGSGGPYHIILTGPQGDISASTVDVNSIPYALRKTTLSRTQVTSMASTMSYTDGRPAEPAEVFGSLILAPDGKSYPIYLIFPLSVQVENMDSIRRITWVTGLTLMVILGIVVYGVTTRTLAPVSEASHTARRLAAGHLDERMKVKGRDDVASLAVSMNHMADELQVKITDLEKASLLQRQFVSDVSHELRTPLTTVRMAADLLELHRHEFNETTSRTVGLLNRELARFELMLSELLEISRYDAGTATLNPDETDIVALVRDTIDQQKALAAALHVRVDLDAPEDCIAEVDAKRVRRIVRNLLTNAIEHAEGRPVGVHVRCSDAAVAVAVRDYGPGFTAEESKKLFERFWRADPSRDRRVGGTGLGLAISLQDAHLHGGWLNAWGRPGLGAQFRLTLPRELGGGLTTSPWPVVPPDRGQTPSV